MHANKRTGYGKTARNPRPRTLRRKNRYYLEPAAESEANLRLMRLIDQQFLLTPFYGSRRMTACLERSGETINRKRV